MDMTVLTNLVMTGIIAIGIAIAGYVAALLSARLVRPIAERFLEPGLANFAVGIVRARPG